MVWQGMGRDFRQPVVMSPYWGQMLHLGGVLLLMCIGGKGCRDVSSSPPENQRSPAVMAQQVRIEIQTGDARMTIRGDALWANADVSTIDVQGNVWLQRESLGEVSCDRLMLNQVDGQLHCEGNVQGLLKLPFDTSLNEEGGGLNKDWLSANGEDK